MGFGHRVYRAEDPRARVLRRTARELGSARFEVAEALEQAALAELKARKPDRVLATNVEFWSAVVLDTGGGPARRSSPACSPAPGSPAGPRTSSSRSARRRLIRPTAKYVGPPPRRLEDARRAVAVG